jgi:ribonuclease P protein component
VAGEGWPKSARLRRRREFLAVQGRGTKAQGQFLTALANPGRFGQRLGLTVSTKVGNSVVRSKVKRRLREAVRKNRRLLPEGADVVLIARPGTGNVGVPELVRDLERIGRALKAKLSTAPGVRGRSQNRGR